MHLATMAYVYTKHVQYMLLFFSTGSKFWPVSILRSYTLILKLSILMRSLL